MRQSDGAQIIPAPALTRALPDIAWRQHWYQSTPTAAPVLSRTPMAWQHAAVLSVVPLSGNRFGHRLAFDPNESPSGHGASLCRPDEGSRCLQSSGRALPIIRCPPDRRDHCDGYPPLSEHDGLPGLDPLDGIRKALICFPQSKLQSYPAFGTSLGMLMRETEIPPRT